MPFNLNGFGKLTTVGRVFLIFGLVLSLFLTASSSAYASPWPWDDVRDAASKFYSDLACVTDVRCWISNVGVGGEDFILKNLAGVGSEELPKIPNEGMLPHSGLVAAAGTITDQLYNYPPDVHLATYFKNEFGNNLLTSPTYASVGTDILSPIYSAWEQMRKIAYAAFVVVMAAVALMIILRKEITPRVVVTVTHALPKIFMSLILITLSYPIVALFVDVLGVWLWKVIDLNIAAQPFPPEIAEYEAEGAIKAFGVLGQQLVVAGLRILALHATTFGVATFVLLLILVIFLLAAVLAIFFVALQIIYRYARILILTIFAPLLLLLGALPGQEGATSGWLKDLAVCTLTFPAILLLARISGIVLVAGLFPAKEEATQIMTMPALQLLAFSVAPLTLGVVAIIILLMSFKVPGLIENALKGTKGRR